MIINKQSATATLAAAVLGFATVASGLTVNAAPTQIAGNWDVFVQAGQPSIEVPVLQQQGQEYVALWYFMKLLRVDGWSPNWSQGSFTLKNFPIPKTSAVSLNNQPLAANQTLSLGGQTNVNFSGVGNALGGSVVFDSQSKTLTLQVAVSTISTGSHDSLAASGLRYANARAMASVTKGTSGKTAKPTTRPKTGTPPKTTTPPKNPSNPKTMKSLSSRFQVAGGSTVSVKTTTSGPLVYVSLSGLANAFAPYGVKFTESKTSIDVTGMPVNYADVKILSPALGKTSPIFADGILWNQAWYVPTKTLQQLGFGAQADATKHAVTLTLVQTPPKSGVTTGGSGTAPVSASSVAVTIPITVSGEVLGANGSPTAGKVTFEDPEGDTHTLVANSQGTFSGTIEADYPSAASAKTGALSLVATDSPTVGWVGQDASLTANNGVISNVVVNAQAQQLFSTLHGHLNYGAGALAAMPVSEVSVRNVITQAHYYAPVDSQGDFNISVPVGPYEVFALITKNSAIYSLQPFIETPNPTSIIIDVPTPPNGKLVTKHAVIVAGDKGVLPEDMLSVANIFEHVYPLDQTTLGLSEKGPITITLYSTLATYAGHFLSEGYSKSEADLIAENSGAVTEGPNSISVPMASFGEMDGLNVLAHELTHAMVATESLQLPSWANEGLAWHQGILGQMDGSPSNLLLTGAEWNQWFDIVQNQKENSLLPLGTASPLSGSYNVEAQDYFAVQQLINQYGMKSVLDYVYQYDSNPSAFQDVFSTPFLSFSQSVSRSLAADAASTDKGFTLTFKVLQGGPSDIYVESPKGPRILVSGLVPNEEYTITCYNNGQVKVPSGLTTSKATSLPVLVSGDWYIGSGVAANGAIEQTSSETSSTPSTSSMELGSGYRQEFEIANQFGVPFLVRAIMYDHAGDVLHAYPALGLPDGLQLVSLAPTEQ